ncbi:hypothetical protein SAMN05518801_101334 [Novosphingobium sp. CF614]|uniref:hypothetical protein n=1 Tax=Novosphingobium sp. CF614 TaxID=1884364 RepID=UPI0008E31AD7|nr:hypothetical protein [Novosphingobium sp. CF614]SFF76341.1 hypothetical protein SAMN05518801_101334 [Novosphingobium sp. CF614]
MLDNPVENLLALWEAGTNPLTLLSAARVESGDTPLAALPLGARDAALIEVQRGLFGPAIETTVPCPACGETAEVVLDAGDLLASARAPDRGATLPRVSMAGWEIEARPADSRDMATIAGLGDVDEAARALTSRLVTSCRHHGREADPATLPAEVIAALGNALEAADPLAAIAVEIACPGCGGPIAALLDPAHHLARSVAAEAHRLLGEVATLARFYGWREADILALSPMRRGAYLELAQ